MAVGKKDFEDIAQRIRFVRFSALIENNPEKSAGAEAVQRELSILFQDNNPLFNRVKFNAACTPSMIDEENERIN